MSSAVGLKICVITAGIKKIKKKNKKHEKIVLLLKKSSSIEVLISRDLIDLYYISHIEFV